MKIFDTKNIFLSIFAFSAQLKAAKAAVYHTDNIEDGAILHAFSWSFNTIKEKLPDIKNAGYTAVQTSPIQECFVGDNGNRYFGNWVYEYQPISQNIGNYIVGTEEEFKSLCAEAKQYGIKIVVDAVLNHMTTNINNCAPEWRDPSLYHEAKGIDNWNDRYQVTQRDLVGLRDIKTQNPDYQQKVLKMLKRIVADGASGFRYDTAKHIELPDDPGYGSEFWPTVLNNGAEFQYGEVLQDGISRDAAYANYMKITASNYGDTILSAINDNDFSTSRIMNYNADVNPNKLITWVESHDNYSNSDEKTVYLTNEKITLAWALITARKSTTPLFFSRPLGGGGGNPQFPNRSQLGDEGDPLYKDSTIAAINLFRNAMVGESEYLRNPNDDSKILMIERGKKGMVIINLNYGQSYIDCATNLADGEYENQINNNSKFKVSGGKISGSLPSRSVTVLYKSEPDGPTVRIAEFNNDKDISFKTDSLKITLIAKNADIATYSIDGQQEIEYEDGEMIEIGQSTSVDSKITVTLNAQGANNTSAKAVYTFIKKDPSALVNIYFQKPSSWGSSINAYIYSQKGSVVSELTKWPGEKMTLVNGNIYTVEVESEYDGANIIFNDGSKQAPGSGVAGFEVKMNGLYNINGFAETYEETNSSTTKTTNSVTIYYYSGWETAYIYYQIGSGKWTNNPGVPMSSYNNDYKKIVIDLGTESSMKFVFNNGNGQWDNNNGNNYSINSSGSYIVKNGNISTVSE